ncbi:MULTISPECIES: GNAT family N-acetyltransferase [unclassified Oceanispirochaeta]|uniref:GNAT family N-acetyltransferase n=1 Tax=unclassified Oceanispirochaeta TaxID=2635722 RepID=UPI000E091DF1|nr:MULTISPECIES: GNAT family N-acetyltransferase [unclassified Oceanispirochaeta]MBF9018929.1 GNAT family N-acetyltransferase [Oceanispirochaeta sp. M2]NPD75428.1 GNAT family N-acetyltransferase [Oceanispirochaeta sp. M1]RDG28713.1 GNAT family N-acetyltransferase [Oceanispirochaeta sp. M1]
MIIRKAVDEDLEQILTLYQFLFSEEDYSIIGSFKEKWASILNHDGLTYFVAIDKDRIVASCNISITPNLSRGKKSYALIENVITHPEHRQRGYGRAVIEKAIDLAQRESCYKVMLLSTASDDRSVAHKFYENLGFDGDSKRGFHIRFR